VVLRNVTPVGLEVEVEVHFNFNDGDLIRERRQSALLAAMQVVKDHGAKFASLPVVLPC
jgi:hypothetical protein